MSQNIRQFIEKLQNKPEETRKQILTGTMIVVGGILFLIWAVTFGESPSTPAKSIITDNEIKPFQMLKSRVVSSYDTVSAGLHGLRQDFVTSKAKTGASSGAAVAEQPNPASADASEPQMTTELRAVPVSDTEAPAGDAATNQ